MCLNNSELVFWHYSKVKLSPNKFATGTGLVPAVCGVATTGRTLDGGGGTFFKIETVLVVELIAAKFKSPSLTA